MTQFTIKSLEGKLILFATILASGIAFLDGSVVNIAIPAIQKDFNANIIDIQWIINSYTLMLCALMLISGALGDRFGRKRIFSSGIGLFILSSFLCSISHSVEQLTIFRALQGLGGAMMVPGSLSIITLSFNEAVRGKAIGIWSGFAGGVAALGPFIGGYLVQVFGWPAIFYINIPFGLLALFLTIKYVPESKNQEATKLDLLGALFIFLSVLGMSYGLISVSNLGWSNSSIIVSLLGSIFAFILFVITEKKVKQPLVPFAMFKSTLVTGANLATLFLYFALSGVIFFLVLNFQQVQHYSPIQAGLAMLPPVLLITFLSGYGGTIADKIGPRIPMIVGPLIVSLGIFLLMLPGKNANYYSDYLPGLLLLGIGMSGVIASLTKSALTVENKFSGAASGINNAIARIAGLLAIAILGIIMLVAFKNDLNAKLDHANMSSREKQQIMSQQNKLGGITIPDSFNNNTKNIAQVAIEDSFIVSFKWAMIINALIAFLSAVISFFTIYNKRAKSINHSS